MKSTYFVFNCHFARFFDVPQHLLKTFFAPQRIFYLYIKKSVYLCTLIIQHENKITN